MWEKQAEKEEWLAKRGELIKVWVRLNKIEDNPGVEDPSDFKSISDRINVLCQTWNKVKSSLAHGPITPVPEYLSKNSVWFEQTG